MFKKLLLKLIRPKIDWSKAPKWANYYHLNRYGSMLWCTKKPSIIKGKYFFKSYQSCGIEYSWWYRLWWRYSLQERPR